MVEEFSKRTLRSRSSGLLAVDGVQSLVNEQAESGSKDRPRRRLDNKIKARFNNYNIQVSKHYRKIRVSTFLEEKTYEVKNLLPILT